MKQKILVIDDEPHILILIESVLKSEKYNVITAGNGKDCLILAEKEKPSLILLDVMMSGMDGWEVCEKIKNNPITKNIPVIMLTAKEKVMYYSVAKNAGADDYISKPFTIRELVETVRKYEHVSDINSDTGYKQTPGMIGKDRFGNKKQVCSNEPGISPKESDSFENIRSNTTDKNGRSSAFIIRCGHFLKTGRFRM